MRLPTVFCKVNINFDSRLVMTATIREIFVTESAEFDTRKYAESARSILKELYKRKCINVLGSRGDTLVTKTLHRFLSEPHFFKNQCFLIGWLRRLTSMSLFLKAGYINPHKYGTKNL